MDLILDKMVKGLSSEEAAVRLNPFRYKEYQTGTHFLHKCPKMMGKDCA